MSFNNKVPFKKYLEKTGEIGYVEEIILSVVYVKGLPEAKTGELVVFENGSLGQISAMEEGRVEILLFSNGVGVGEKVARTNQFLEIGVGEHLLGKTIDPLGRFIGETPKTKGKVEQRGIDAFPIKILERKEIDEPLETGVTMVDLLVPLAKGQRELVIGDRDTGKTSFIKQVIANQVKRNAICIYAAIGKKLTSVKRFNEFIQKKGLSKGVVSVVSFASDGSGLNFLTPYSAMTIAEYFRDKGRDVIVILDDLSSHAKHYREISLLGRRFPGRSSYPGDIFFVHSRLLERAGNFKKGSISCLPLSLSVMGDLSGYIQTNLMAMTDGHIFFDSELFNEGRFPAVNPFLSVTRVGLQVQDNLFKNATRELTSFLVKLTKARQYMHFGAEVSDEVKKILSLGDRLEVLFEQPSDTLVPVEMGVFLSGTLWAHFWDGQEKEEVRKKMDKMIETYKKNKDYQKQVDKLLSEAKSFSDLADSIRLNDGLVNA